APSPSRKPFRDRVALRIREPFRVDADIRRRALGVEAARLVSLDAAVEQPREHVLAVAGVAHEPLELDLADPRDLLGLELREASRECAPTVTIETHETLGRHPMLDVVRTAIRVLIERIAHDDRG